MHIQYVIISQTINTHLSSDLCTHSNTVCCMLPTVLQCTQVLLRHSGYSMFSRMLHSNTYSQCELSLIHSHRVSHSDTVSVACFMSLLVHANSVTYITKHSKHMLRVCYNIVRLKKKGKLDACLCLLC